MGVTNYMYCLDCDVYIDYGGRNGIYVGEDDKWLNLFGEWLKDHTNHCISPQSNDCGDLQELADPYFDPREDKKKGQIEFLEKYSGIHKK